MTRAERAVLLLAAAVLAAGVAGAVVLAGDEGDAPGAVPTGGPSAAPTSPTTSTPTSVPAVLGSRVSTYARGSHSLVVSVHVQGARAASLQVASRTYPLRLLAGQASGTVPVGCGAAAPALTLLLTGSDGEVVALPLELPRAAFDTACAAPLPAAPVPTNSPSRGS